MDPFTIAAGIGALGSLFHGVTGFFGAGAQAKSEQLAATQHLQEGGVAGDEALRQGDQVAARAATQAAANGGGLVGSSLGVISQLSNQAMFNARAQGYRARTEARNDLYQSSVARTQGLDALAGGAIGAGSSLAGGFMRSSIFARQMQSLGTLRGYGADTPYDYMMFGGY